MSDSKTIKTAWERNKKAVSLHPEIGKKTAVTKIRLLDGTTCEVEHKHWKFKVDIGTSEGGNDAGPDHAVLAAFSGGPVALAYHKFDEKTRTEAHQEYLNSIAQYENSNGFDIPGEFVIPSGFKT